MFETIKEWLESEGIEFRQVHHAPTRTSQESADARGEALATGGKALVLKIGDIFVIHVIAQRENRRNQSTGKQPRCYFLKKNLAYPYLQE